MADRAHTLDRLYSAAWYPSAAVEQAAAMAGDSCVIELKTTAEGTQVRVSGAREVDVWRVFHDLGNLALSCCVASGAS